MKIPAFANHIGSAVGANVSDASEAEVVFISQAV
jgi:hypothetical protein